MRTQVAFIGRDPFGLWLLQMFFVIADHDDASLPLAPRTMNAGCRMPIWHFGKPTPPRALMAENDTSLPY
jgi:hypothetical protein